MSPQTLLFRYGCGCIGMLPGEDRHAIIVKACNNPEGEYYIFPRNMGDFAAPSARCAALTDEEATKVFDELAGLLADGYRFRHMRALLNGGM